MTDDRRDDPSASGADASVDRRSALKRMAYVPPAIIGTLAMAREAMAQASCGPAGCTPNCAPNCAPVNPCGPNNPCSPDNPCGPDNPCPPGR